MIHTATFQPFFMSAATPPGIKPAEPPRGEAGQRGLRTGGAAGGDRQRLRFTGTGAGNVPKAMDDHFDLHKAYIQSWIETLEKDPQELFVAIKDANSIANYLMEKGEFLQGQELAKEKRQIQQPKRQGTKYIPADLIELARSQDVFDILQRTGEPLVKRTASGALWRMTAW